MHSWQRLAGLMAALILLLSLGAGLVHAQENDSFEGDWLDQADDLVLHIEGTQAILWAQFNTICVPYQTFTLDGNRVLAGGQAVFTLDLQDGDLVVKGAGLTFAPTEGFETVCPTAINTDSITSLADIDQVMNEVVTQAQMPGLAVAVVQPGKVLWAQGYGYANVEAEQPVTPDTPFMLASVTKLFTGMALMHAVQDGLITLDTPINEVLPFVVDNPHVDGEVITVRHLVTHTSGILDDYDTYLSMYTTSGDSPVELGDFLEGYLVPGGEWYNADGNYADRLPGVTHEYSNVGAALTGYIVEQVTGMPLDQYAQSFLFGPLGMTNTHWHLADYPDPSIIAVPYQDGTTPLAYYGNPTWPAGQLRSSANDVARFLAAIMNGGEIDGVRILEEATVAEMLKPALPDVDPNIGVFWGLNYPSAGLVGHAGGDPGVNTLVFFQPASQYGFVLLYNSDEAQKVSMLSNFVLGMLGAHMDVLGE